MSHHFVFLGEPGPDAPAMLRALNDAGLAPRRIQIAEDLRSQLVADPPAAVVFGPEIEDRAGLVASLRESSVLTSVPFIGRVAAAHPNSLSQAFRDGMDEYYLDGCSEQFTELANVLGQSERGSTVRAPAGQVILAHPDRLERVRLASVLRRNGYDTHFAGSAEELRSALLEKRPRAVVASTGLPGVPVVEMVCELDGTELDTIPWVVVAPEQLIDETSEALPAKPQSRILEDGADVEGLTFLMNEMLTPPPVGVRRSPRLLFGAPAAFVNEGGEVVFQGYTYNVSMGGVYLRSLTPFPLQTRITVDFQPPYGRGRVVADAQVCWVKRLGDTGGAASPPGMGIQFLSMDVADDAGFEAGYRRLLDQNQETPSKLSHPPTAL